MALALIVRVLFGAVLALSAGISEGETYPARSVRLVVPFPPSGGTDLLGRLVAQKLGEQLKQTFVVDNRGGAAGTLGAQIVAKAPTDGYTLLFASASFAISASYYKSLPYDSLRDFAAVGLVASQPLALIVHPSVRAQTVRELIALARAEPDKLNFASSSAGSITHLAAELLKSMTGTRMLHVPYKGAAPATTAVLMGEAQLFFAPLGPSLGHIRAGRIRALGLGSAKRSTIMPELSTIAEAGVPGYEADTWYGLLAPAGSSKGVIAALNRGISAGLKDADVLERLGALGFDAAVSAPEDFAAYVRSEIHKWGETMKQAGMRPS
jgi:tripartite-type tricarboxylate transporter receptor subunit TctC